jgi:hypothetical protein
LRTYFDPTNNTKDGQASIGTLWPSFG